MENKNPNRRRQEEKRLEATADQIVGEAGDDQILQIEEKEEKRLETIKLLNSRK